MKTEVKDVHILEPTMNLRWANVNKPYGNFLHCEVRVLQQAFVDKRTGEIEWREIEEVR